MTQTQERIKVEVPKYLLEGYGNSPSHAAVIFKGALARHDGKLISDNPYDMYKAASFFNAWNRGWIGLDMGEVVIKKGGDSGATS